MKSLMSQKRSLNFARKPKGRILNWKLTWDSCLQKINLTDLRIYWKTGRTEDGVNLTSHAKFHSGVAQVKSSLRLLRQHPVFNSSTGLTVKCQAHLFIRKSFLAQSWVCRGLESCWSQWVSEITSQSVWESCRDS